MNTPPPASSGTRPRQKAVLFCPDCSHESALTGDWLVHEAGRHQVYDCPVCGTTITKRRRARPVPTA